MWYSFHALLVLICTPAYYLSSSLILWIISIFGGEVQVVYFVHWARENKFFAEKFRSAMACWSGMRYQSGMRCCSWVECRSRAGCRNGVVVGADWKKKFWQTFCHKSFPANTVMISPCPTLGFSLSNWVSELNLAACSVRRINPLCWAVSLHTEAHVCLRRWFCPLPVGLVLFLFPFLLWLKGLFSSP